MEQKEEIFQEINEMRKISKSKRKEKNMKIILSIIILLFIGITTVIVKFLISVPGITIKNGKKEYYNDFINWITNYKNDSVMDTKVTNFFVETNIKGDLGQEVLYRMIFTFDENNICIGTRCHMEGYTDEEIERRRENLENANPAITNFRVEDKKMMYSYNRWTGDKKEQIKNEFKNQNNYKIYEY